MKKILSLFLLASSVIASAQTPSVTSNLPVGRRSDVIVPFSWNDPGQRLPIQWGFDLAWLDESNLGRGIIFAGQDLCDIVRVSYRPTESVESGVLSASQKEYLKKRAEYVKKWCKPDVTININDDHETVANWYQVQSGVSVQESAKRWAQLIELHRKSYAEDYGLTVESVSPFNESDYGWGQGSTDDNTRKQIFNNIDKILIDEYGYHDMGIRLCGGNTLNCDRAYDWWNALKTYVDEGNTHQLAGDFDHYASFYQKVRDYGHHATNDELHNTMEAMVGVEYGLQTGIWWGTADYCRSQFMKASNKGARLCYGEHRSNWTSATVYRHDDGQVEAFVGSSERQGVETTFGITCLENPVWVDGVGPYYEYPLHVPGGTGYQIGQSNAETVVNVQCGDDIQPEIPTGLCNLINKSKSDLTPVAGTAKWYISHVPEKIGGDFSGFYFTTNSKDSIFMDLENFNLNDGANIIQYKGNGGNQEQWHLRYAGDGWFYIISRHSGKCVDIASGSAKMNTINGTSTQLWRILPANVTFSKNKPYAPKDLVLTPQSASVRLDWTLASFRTTKYYNYDVQRSKDGENWYFIARNIYGSTFVDNTAEAGQEYYYRVAQHNASGYYSDWLTSTETASAKGDRAMVMNLDMEDRIFDATENANHPGLYGDTLMVDGHEGKALNLNGKQYMMIPHTAVAGNEITVSAWVNWKGGSNWQRIFDFGNGTDQYFFLTPNSDGGLRVAIKNKGDEFKASYSSKLATNKWVHLAVTISEDAITLYRDGVQIAINTASRIRLSDIKPMLNYIGRSQFIADPLFNGLIDDFQVYNYAMTAEEISNIATAIDVVRADENTDESDSKSFDLAGRKANANSKGIIIRNGEKMLKR